MGLLCSSLGRRCRPPRHTLPCRPRAGSQHHAAQLKGPFLADSPLWAPESLLAAGGAALCHFCTGWACGPRGCVVGGLGLGVCVTWVYPAPFETWLPYLKWSSWLLLPWSPIRMNGEDEERWLRSCCSSGFFFFFFGACCPHLNHWLAPILGCTEVPGAKVGGDDGDPEFKLTLRPVPALVPGPGCGLQHEATAFTDGRSLGSTGLLCL